MKTITKHEADTLRKILATGGDVRESMGRQQHEPGYVRTATLNRLYDMGYVRTWARDEFGRRVGGRAVTAAGCIALKEYDEQATLNH